MKGGGFILRRTITVLTTLLLCMVVTVPFIEQNRLNNELETQRVEMVEEPIAGVLKAQYDILKVAQETPIEIHESEVVEVAEPQWIEMDGPSNNSFKSYMDCSCITDTSSAQYAFKSEYLSSASGIMIVDGRYVVAVGSYYATEIGTRIDLVMESNEIVPCVVGDVKADCHTDSTNRQHSVDGSVCEFIVATDNLSDKVRAMGDVSYADERLMGEIKAIRVYLEN